MVNLLVASSVPGSARRNGSHARTGTATAQPQRGPAVPGRKDPQQRQERRRPRFRADRRPEQRTDPTDPASSQGGDRRDGQGQDQHVVQVRVVHRELSPQRHEQQLRAQQPDPGAHAGGCGDQAFGGHHDRHADADHEQLRRHHPERLDQRGEQERQRPDLVLRVVAVQVQAPGRGQPPRVPPEQQHRPVVEVEPGVPAVCGNQHAPQHRPPRQHRPPPTPTPIRQPARARPGARRWGGRAARPAARRPGPARVHLCRQLAGAANSYGVGTQWEGGGAGRPGRPSSADGRAGAGLVRPLVGVHCRVLPWALRAAGATGR